MKISLNWIKEFTDVDISVDELVTKIGAQLGAVEEVIDLGKKYQGIVIAKVVSCEKHPNADKLSLCKVDDGGKVQGVERDENGHVQVVCGAPNVREGLMVAWLPPGATVPSTFDSDPFVLGARELRGYVSNGMLASGKELEVNEDHSGIVEIDFECLPGADFAEIYKLNDYIIDVENKMFTHRPDCFGILGVAREIAGIQGIKFRSPDWYLNADLSLSPSGLTLDLQVSNELPELVPRFMAVAISNVEVKPSKLFNQTFLSRVGIRPINNIVDYTNYYMYLTGQPLHAYDYDKVAARSGDVPTLTARLPRQDEKLTLLGGKVIEPRDGAIVIATDKEAIGLGGVMGGADTEVDDNTKNVILECANFDMYSIRRTSMYHGLFTDAVTRFNKGQSPLQNDRVLAICGQAICDSGTGGFGQVFDIKNENLEVYSRYNNFKTENGETAKVFSWGSMTAPITLTAGFINERLGTQLKSEQITHLLQNVEINAHQDNQEDRDEIEVVVPFWRTDLQIEEDIVEEVGRLYGYDNLPHVLPKRNVVPPALGSELVCKQRLRTKLATFGANEVLTYSFVHGDLLDKVGQDSSLAFKINNALSPDLQYYRLSLLPSLLTHVHANIKAGHDEFSLFEIGKVHSKTEVDEAGLPREFGRLAFVYAEKNAKQTNYYTTKQYLESALERKVTFVPFDEVHLNNHALMTQMVKPFEPTRSAMILDGEKGYLVGIVGEFSAATSKNLKLPKYSAGFEVFLSAMRSQDQSNYRQLSRFPSISQDVCFQVESSLNYGELAQAFEEGLVSSVRIDETVDWQPLDIYSSEELAGKKRITFRVRLNSSERTLTDDVLSKLLNDTCGKLAGKISFEIV